MKSIREILEEEEKKYLSKYACLSCNTKGRKRKETECEIRTAFQKDRDKIMHSKSFRRLKHKTQVFFSPTGDHYRTRLTHTLDVAQIARTISRALHLNESLTEAIALAHDLGHTPFGHSGEETLNKLYREGFKHVTHSLRVVDILENDGAGLNLTSEVRDGILGHSKGRGEILGKDDPNLPKTLEGQVVRIADIMAYINHDTDDGIRGGVIKKEELPKNIVKILGETASNRIDTMVKDVVYTTRENDDGKIHISSRIYEAMVLFRDFLWNRVYDEEKVHTDFIKASKLIEELYHFYISHSNEFEKEIKNFNSNDPLDRRVCDYIAGMTDRFVLIKYEEIFLPKPWMIY
jgi:dGTPase